MQSDASVVPPTLMHSSLAARGPVAALVLALVLTTLSAQPVLPAPPVPAGNPQTRAKELLGQALFWDEQLSSTRTVACGTCHIFGRGGSDPRTDAVDPGADGIEGTDDDVHGSAGVVRHDRRLRWNYDAVFGMQPQVTPRKAPSVINAAYAVALFDDGRASDRFADPVTGAAILPQYAALESQAAAPPVSDLEMAHVGRSWPDIAAELPRLQPLALASNLPASLQQFVAGQSYASLFRRVFGSPGVTPNRIIFAIAAYERTLISDQSPFDLYLAGRGSLGAAELAGLTKFQQLCIACHTDVDPSVLVSGPVNNDYRNLGVRPVAEDPGRFAVTGDAVDRGRFRVPGLRNVALRAPYFHNGSAATLGQLIDFYARGGDFADNRDPLLARIPGQIDNVDRIMLQRFLESLTDPRVANELPPFDRPTLWSESARAPVRVGVGTGPVLGPVPRVSFNMPAFADNAHFGLAVDRVAAGVPVALLLDVADRATPVRVLGIDLHLGMTPALIAIALTRPTAGAGATDGRASLRLPVPAAPGAWFAAQWVMADGNGPSGLTSSEAIRVPLF